MAADLSRETPFREDSQLQAASACSVDPEEVQHYQRLSEDWWDAQGPFRPLHKLNTLRIDWITQQLAGSGDAPNHPHRPLAGLNVLDIGCGGGILSEALALRGATVHGVDVVHQNISIARTHASDTGFDIRYEVNNAETLAANGNTYDVVFNMEVVEHVARLDTFMTACCALVKPGGHMFVATINRTPIARIAAIYAAERILKWLPRGTHSYHKLRRPEEIEGELQRGSLRPIKWTGVRVNPLGMRFSLTSRQSINYMVHAVKTSA